MSKVTAPAAFLSLILYLPMYSSPCVRGENVQVQEAQSSCCESYGKILHHIVHHLITSLQYNQEVIVVIWEPSKSFEYFSSEAADPHICQQIDKRLWDYLRGNDLVSAAKYLSMCFLQAAEAMQVVLLQGRSVLAP